MRNNFTTRDLALSGIVAAIYIVLTLTFAELSYFGIQFRLSEALLLLVFIDPKFSFGILLGTFVANLLGPFGLIDAVFGSLASGISILGIYIISRKFTKTSLSLFLSGIIPTVVNAIYVPILLAAMDPQFGTADYLPTGITVAVGEFMVVSVIGTIIISTIIKNKELMNILDKRL